MCSNLVSVLQAFCANSSLCVNGGACDDHECKSACMGWADLIQVESEQLSVAIKLIEQMTVPSYRVSCVSG